MLNVSSARRAMGAALLTLVGAAAAGAQIKTGDVAKRGLKTSDFPRTKQLAPGVYSYEALRAGDPGGYMTTNSLIVVSNDGVLVADGQGTEAQVKEMVDWIKKTTDQPIKYVVICSDHGDHTAGNAAFPAGVTFISSPASMRVLQAAGKPPLPTDSVPHRRVLHLGNKDVEILNLGRAHTGGDLEVWVPSDKVLFMSEAYLHSIFPAMRSAYPTEWVQTVRNAETIPAVWFIPGHGFIDDAATLKADLPVYRRAMERVIAEATRLHDAHVPCEAPQRGAGRGASGAPRQMCQAAREGNWGDLKDWTLYSTQLETAIRRIYEELDGKLSD